MYSSQHISEIINAKLVGDANHSVKHILIDSRQLTEPSNSVFVALETERNDGHQYIYGLYQKGVKTFIVKQIPGNCLGLHDACFLIVQNTLKALQQLAIHHRSQFSTTVIGVTGSNGKTVVKEWLYQLLKSDYVITRSPKSYNSQVGVPLSVWQLNSNHTLGIFEAGISEVGEMNLLREIIQPAIGVFTSLGSAHDEGFKNSSQKLEEKLLLFSNCETIIVNALSIKEEQLQLLPKNTFLISKNAGATLRVIEIENLFTHTIIIANYNNQQISINIPFTDSASVDNAITCWGTLLHLKISQAEIEKRMLLLQAVAMRLELKLGNNNCVLINDFYNSDINALEIALHHQKQQHRGGKKVVILSDIEQSGKLSWELYEHVSKLMAQFHIDTVIGIGKEISSQQELFVDTDAHFFESTNEFIHESKINTALQFHNAIILLKGARSFGFETISKQLQQKSHDTVLEINLNRLVHNINFYRAQVTKDVMLMCMVKATGYGSGSTEIAFTLQHHHVDYLAVAYADEGVELRKAGIHLPIMVMSPEESCYDDMIDYHLEPEIYSFKIARDFIQALQSKAISESYPVHIKLDTGMKRLGFESNKLNELCEFLKVEPLLRVKSIFSHLVASDDKAFDEFTNSQIALFEKHATQIEHAVGYHALKHICNSGAITRFKSAHYNMVRLGIGMYGIGFNEVEKIHLENISSLKTRISQIKELEVGESVGYNRKGLATKKTKIATIPIGYADGFSRKLGNANGYVFINKKACKTIGNICMDMCMIDVTDVDCKEGDEVIVFETYEQLMQLSKAMETIPYEVLTSISSRVKRVYVQE